MDKQKISRQLHRLAQEEIPDTMNLWPKIHGQLKRKPKPRSFSLAHTLSVFVMTMLVAVGGYAAYQTGSAPDPVAPSYGVEPNLSQTENSITATVDWAYADEKIIAIQYSVTYDQELITAPIEIYTQLSENGIWFSHYGRGSQPAAVEEGSTKYTTISYFNPSILTTGVENVDVVMDVFVSQQNNIFEPISPEVADYFGLIIVTMPPDDSTATPVPFDGNLASPVPFVGEFEPTVPPPDNFTATATPFGEFEPTVPPPDAMTIEPSLIPPIAFTSTPVPVISVTSIDYGTIPDGIFRFNFTLPVHQTRTGQATTAQAESDRRMMSIQNIEVSPLLTSFELCYQYPDILGTWYPKVAVDTGFAPADAQRYSPIIETMLEDYGTLYEASEDNLVFPYTNWQMGLDSGDYTNCVPLSSFAAIAPEANELDIRVDYLYRETDPTDLAVWNNDVDFFASRGISVQYELSRGNVPELSENVLLYPLLDIGSIMVTIQDYPETMTLEDASSFVRSNMLKERVEGDWSFHITLE